MYIYIYIYIHIYIYISKRLLFDCFNDSLLHGLKGSRSRLYDGIMLQGLDCMSHINLPEAYIFLKQVPTCVRIFKTNTFDESIKCLYFLYFKTIENKG